MSNYRWRICALLFFASTINYLDRHVLSILAPDLQAENGWSEIDYGYIVTAFQAAYGIGVIIMGRLLDKYGARMIFSIAIAVWSFAGMAHALARSAFGFGVARFMLGLGESANFPAAIKVVAEWFPKKERALATGIFNAGSMTGAIVSPLLVPWIVVNYGWQWAFIITGGVGFIWLVFWLLIYKKPEKHKKVNTLELEHIESDQTQEPEKKLGWGQVIFRKEVLIICAARFLTDPVWWFLLYWLPKFLNKNHGITISDVGIPLIVIYLSADVGSIVGGAVSSRLIQKGMALDKARKLTLLICALGVVPIIFASQTSSLWVSVALISLATASHCGWMANVYTLISDIMPKNAVASVVGVSTFSAVVGSMLVSTAIGFILDATNSYYLIFFIAGFMYLIAWFIIKFGIPVIKDLKFEERLK
ncbi:MFS transporter [Flavobacteriaceae bacterium MHTCC 0001]